MRVNVYAEEMTDRVEIVSKEIDGKEFTAVRFYLYLPVTLPLPSPPEPPLENGDTLYRRHVQGPFLHRDGDDDSSAVTFWGKRDLRPMLRKALRLLDEHYAQRDLDGVLEDLRTPRREDE